jgi:hypothetical protein
LPGNHVTGINRPSPTHPLATRTLVSHACRPIILDPVRPERTSAVVVTAATSHAPTRLPIGTTRIAPPARTSLVRRRGRAGGSRSWGASGSTGRRRRSRRTGHARRWTSQNETNPAPSRCHGAGFTRRARRRDLRPRRGARPVPPRQALGCKPKCEYDHTDDDHRQRYQGESEHCPRLPGLVASHLPACRPPPTLSRVDKDRPQVRRNSWCQCKAMQM